MTSLDPQAVQQMALRGATPRSAAVPIKAAEVKFTPAESVLWIENLANALHRNPRLLADVATIRDGDGSLTIRVTPQNP